MNPDDLPPTPERTPITDEYLETAYDWDYVTKCGKGDQESRYFGLKVGNDVTLAVVKSGQVWLSGSDHEEIPIGTCRDVIQLNQLVNALRSISS